MTEKRGPGRPRRNPEIAPGGGLIDRDAETNLALDIAQAWSQAGYPVRDSLKAARLAIKVVREHG